MGFHGTNADYNHGKKKRAFYCGVILEIIQIIRACKKTLFEGAHIILIYENTLEKRRV